MNIDPRESATAREGIPSWVLAASVGLSLLAAGAIVVRTVGLVHGPSRLAAEVEAEHAADSLVIADDEPAGPTPAPIYRPSPPPEPARGVAILASHSIGSASATPRVEPRFDVAPTAVGGVERARREIAACLARYNQIHDYSCVFHKRERIKGRLITPHIMTMKVRAAQGSIYFKFHQPNRGREAIFVPGRNGGKILAHDVGLGKLLAGTMKLDPSGSMAMEENLHPIHDAGIGPLIRTVAERWNAELDPAESLVTIHEHAKVADRVCRMIETAHPSRGPNYLFHKVKLFVDREHGLPIRFEAYDWPGVPGGEPELIEEYTYADLKTDTGMTDRDFDPANPLYSFGRF